MHCLNPKCTHTTKRGAKSKCWDMFQLCPCCLTLQQVTQAGMTMRGVHAAETRCRNKVKNKTKIYIKHNGV